jgi:nucleoside phosphorylase
MKQIQRSSNTTLGSVDFGRFGKDQNVRVALVRCQQGPSDTQTVATNCARILNPKVVLFIGICATMKPQKADLGDVMISAKLAAYDHKKIEAGGKVVYRGPIANVSSLEIWLNLF